MARNKLTAAEVANAGEGVHGDGAGLNLRIKGTSRKWIYRFTRDGKVTELGLGSAHAVPLKLARKLRDQHEQALAQGLDPRSERSKRKVVAKTFAEAAGELIATRRQKWRANATTGRETSLSEWRVHLVGVCQPIAKRPVGEIAVEEVKAVVKPYFDRGASNTGWRLLKRIERVFAFAKAHGWRKSDNPAGREIFEHILQSDGKPGPTPMHAALDWRETPAFMARLRARRESMARLALELIILTACRSGEVRGLMWSEIEGATWRLPPERMKRQREHLVPLSTDALALLAHLESARTGSYVFPGNEAVIGHTMIWNLTKELSDGKATVHGWRSSFRSWAAHRRLDHDVCELCLAHDVGTQVSRRYNREQLLDARREVMQMWADFLGGEAVEKASETAEIIDLPKLRLRA